MVVSVIAPNAFFTAWLNASRVVMKKIIQRMQIKLQFFHNDYWKEHIPSQFGHKGVTHFAGAIEQIHSWVLARLKRSSGSPKTMAASASFSPAIAIRA
jgi:hypothetical protein